MFKPKPSAIGIAPLNSTIGTILTNATIMYFTISGKLDIWFSPFNLKYIKLFVFYYNYKKMSIYFIKKENPPQKNTGG